MGQTLNKIYLPAFLRLQEEAKSARERAEQQQAGAAKALAEECERHSASEKQLQQQIKELSSQLAVSQASVGRPGGEGGKQSLLSTAASLDLAMQWHGTLDRCIVFSMQRLGFCWLQGPKPPVMILISKV
jgi:hypothetical protein